MNDEAFIYRQEVNERANIARSAYNKANGSNTVKLGNKELSRKEIEEKHGPVYHLDLNKFYTFEQFRELPEILQVEYINHLQDKYDIGLIQINKHLFKQKDESVLRSHLKLKGILDKCNPNKKRGKTGINSFIIDIAAYVAPVTPDSEPIEFMSYDEFRALSRKDQVSFLKSVTKEYDVSLASIAKEIFEVPKFRLQNYAYRHLKDEDIGRKLHGGDIRSKEYKAKMERFRSAAAKWKMSKAFKTNVMPLESVSAETKCCCLESKETPMEFSSKELSIKEVPSVETKSMVFHTSYVSEAINFDGLKQLSEIFKGKKMLVEVTLTVV